MQDFISFIKYILESNIINFAIMLIILGYIVIKANLKQNLENSVTNVQDLITQSDEELKKSKKILKESEKIMQKLPMDIKDLENEAESKAEVFKREIEESTQKTIFSIEQNINRTIAIEEEKFSNLLKGRTINSSIELAKENLIKLLQEQPELHGKFIQESLDELDKVKI